MHKKGRFDFVIERATGDDDDERIVRIAIRPDPRRYSEVKQDGTTYFLDKYLKVLVPLDEMHKEMAGLPIFRLSPTIQSSRDYANSRREHVTNELQGGNHTPPQERASPHQDLTASELRDLAFLSVDICGSTAYRKDDSQGFEKAYAILIRELGTLVGQFNGSILKLTGDGFIAYIDHPSFTSQCDATIDLGLSLLVLVRDTINPSLHTIGLSPIAIRVGADYGPATMRTITIPATNYQSVEVASDALNRAVKIEQSCDPNQFRIGRELYELVHVQWLERSTEVPFAGESVGIPDYRVYALR
jgi:class 3 adenylate cyclase